MAAFRAFLILQLSFSFLSLLPFSSSISFQISRFEPDAINILYEGDARSNVGVVEFNSQSYLFQVGRVKYADMVRIWDSDTNRVSDFTTRFSFVIDTLGSATYAAGLAFFMAPVGFQIPPNSGGGFLGLFNTTTSFSSQNQIVLVEFDSFPNPEWDPAVEHVGININTVKSDRYTEWNASLHSGDTAEAIISYNAATMNLSVSWSYRRTSSSSYNTSLWHQVDLTEILPERVTIGFSAATSYLIERHQLLAWEFNSTLDVNEEDAKVARRMRLMIGLMVSLGVLTIGTLTALAFWWKRRRRAGATRHAMETTNLTSINYDIDRNVGPRKFSFANLVLATNNFSNERKLGAGGFGAVYKGYVNDAEMTTIAVKRISKGSKQGKKEYLTEVKVISQLRHRYLVQLIGWCHDKNEFLLVYEFMPNGSLDSHLFGKKAPLSWALRYKIALGLASALFYLHEEWEQCVIHRDIKSSNVMLDSNFNAKLGDFGLARLTDHELGPQTATGLAGTFGYMAPEYITTRRASKESDVYSFGVVLLEIATGKKPVHPVEQHNSPMGLVEWVWNMYGNGHIISAVDERLNKVFDAEQVERLMIVGLWCAYPDYNIRPSVRQAIQVLQFEAVVPNLPAKMPVPVYQAAAASSSTSSTEPLATNSSITVGR